MINFLIFTCNETILPHNYVVLLVGVVKLLRSVLNFTFSISTHEGVGVCKKKWYLTSTQSFINNNNISSLCCEKESLIKVHYISFHSYIVSLCSLERFLSTMIKVIKVLIKVMIALYTWELLDYIFNA